MANSWYRVQRKISGPVHVLTYDGDTGEDITQGGLRYRKFVTRKDIKDLTESACHHTITLPEAMARLKDKGKSIGRWCGEYWKTARAW